MRQRTIRARDGLALSVREWPGDPHAVPLLCLSGLARTSLDFLATAARHAGHRRVVALDYAGHGDSARAEPARYRVEATLRDVMDVMAALHLHRPVILGTSLGGILGMALGVLRPGAIRALVLNDTGARLESVGLDFIRGFIGRDPAFATRAEAAAFLRETLPPLGLPDAAFAAAAESTYAPGADGRWHPRWDVRIVDAMPLDGNGPTELWPLFHAVGHVPLLLVWGEASAVLSADTVGRMRAARPDMRVVALPGIGHAPTLVEPEAVAAIDRFVAEAG